MLRNVKNFHMYPMCDIVIEAFLLSQFKETSVF